MADATKALAPVRSPRRLYKIPNLVRRKGTGEEAESTVGVGYVYMKRSVAEFLGLGNAEVGADDPDWYYTREIGGVSVKFRKNLGGHKYKQIHLCSFEGMELSEYITDKETGEVTTETTKFKRITIGLPSGVSMGRMFDYLKGSDAYSQIDKIITHDGKPIFVKSTQATEQ